jgi:predicted house-cleaning noncanonical NTP pyrophosphatase (MazG superfamily)
VKVYNKLVRDLIPEIIRERGATCETRTLPEEEFRQALRTKLREEVEEYLESGELSELADIYEVIRALAEADGHGGSELEAARARKEKERGAFGERTFLASVSEPKKKIG